MVTARLPVEVFYSYSHKDEALRKKLETHLSILQRTDLIVGWHDRQIEAGIEWEAEIQRHLNSAQIILLLVSPDFLASDYAYGVELERAMQRHAAGEARVIPIILRPVDWEGAPFAKLKALPKDAKAVTLWPNRDKAFLDVARGIRRSIEELPARVGPPPQPAPVPKPPYTVVEPMVLGLTTELWRRTEILAGQMANLEAAVSRNTAGMGIHRSQVAAINLLLAELLNVHQRALDELSPAQGWKDFVEVWWDLDRDLASTEGLLILFRAILAQRTATDLYREALDAADHIAADCYLSSLKQARTWEILSPYAFREPPLTYFMDIGQSIALRRRLQIPFDIQNLKLPIPVIALQPYQSGALWTLSSLYHDVGKVLDQDLGLRQAFGPMLEQRMAAGGRETSRSAVWASWLHDVIGDAFGILFGGGAFAHSVTGHQLLPVAEATTIDVRAALPTPYIRTFLLGALLRRCGLTALTAVANEIESTWRAWYGEPEALTPFLADCSIVAAVLLEEPLQPLHGHRLLDFANLEHDQAQSSALAHYLRLGLMRPNPGSFPVRLVPAAAELAVRSATENNAEVYRAIQQRAAEFIEAIPRPIFL